MLPHLDLAFFHLVNGWCGNPVLDRIVRYEEQGNLLKGGLILAIYWWFWFADPDRGRRSNRQTIIAAILGALAALVIARVLAWALPFRPRPMYVPGIGYHAPSVEFEMNMEDWSSFPSDTAAVFIALSFGIFRLSRPAGVAMLIYSTVWICLPRAYLGIHYASDLIAGALLGIATVWATIRAMEVRDGALGRHVMDRLTAIEHEHRKLFYATAFLVSFEIGVLFDDVRRFAHGLDEGVHRFHFGGPELILACGIVLLAVVSAMALWWLLRKRAPSPARPIVPTARSNGLPRQT